VKAQGVKRLGARDRRKRSLRSELQSTDGLVDAGVGVLEVPLRASWCEARGRMGSDAAGV
jgi:hypothetical protein